MPTAGDKTSRGPPVAGRRAAPLLCVRSPARTPRPAAPSRPARRKHRPSLRTLLMQLIPNASTFHRPPKDLDKSFIACKVHSTFALKRGSKLFSVTKFLLTSRGCLDATS